MIASFYYTRNYENNTRFEGAEKQSQTKPIAGLWPEILNKTNGYGMT